MSTVFPVAADPRYRISTATGGQTLFAIPFPWLADDDITVEKTDTNGVTSTLTRATHYTLTGRGNPSGGSLTLKSGYVAKTGEIYTIIGAAVLSRSGSIVQGGRFASALTDEDLDRLTIIAQELKRDVLRALKAPYGAAAPTVEIGAAGSIPVWDADGNLTEGPAAAAIDAIEAALGVAAGRALVHGEGASDPYDAGSRKIIALAAGVEAGDAINKAQLDALATVLDPGALTTRVEALEKGWYTGDFKFRFDYQAPTGWLCVWGGSIGDATSGATVRANADTEALFTHIWNLIAAGKLTDADHPIYTQAGALTTRGANAAADYAAHMRLTLPDMSDRFPRASSAVTRPMGTKEANQNKLHNHSAVFAGAALPVHAHGITGKLEESGGDSNAADFGTGLGAGDNSIPTTSVSAGTPSGTVTVNSSGGTEARPDSYCLLPLIKL